MLTCAHAVSFRKLMELVDKCYLYCTNGNNILLLFVRRRYKVTSGLLVVMMLASDIDR